MHALRTIGERSFAPSDGAVVSRPLLAGEYAEPTPSPVHDLHALLEAAYLSEPHVRKWPPSLRLGVLFAAAAAPWAVLVFGARALLA